MYLIHNFGEYVGLFPHHKLPVIVEAVDITLFGLVTTINGEAAAMYPKHHLVVIEGTKEELNIVLRLLT